VDIANVSSTPMASTLPDRCKRPLIGE
jgi:hypothetical protein